MKAWIGLIWVRVGFSVNATLKLQFSLKKEFDWPPASWPSFEELSYIMGLFHLKHVRKCKCSVTMFKLSPFYNLKVFN
jgi:hypothetical protein